MKITVVNGTEKHGITYKLKEMFLEPFKDKAEITEFYLPKDGPGYCVGCITCFGKGEKLCKDAACIQKIEKALLEADLLVFTSPSYVMHPTGAMKALLDHFGYRWMPHRPAKEMFGKRAVIITQALGAGEGSTAKDIKDSLSWWGISYIKICKFKLMGDVVWDRLSEKKRRSMTNGIARMAKKFAAIDYSKKAGTNLITKVKFYMVRSMQTGLGKENPEYTDFKYWKANGWLGSVRPWKAA
ncbi:Multimeric flavodoxin WrbA [Ruminococcaceae bacterium YAD3003]|nr:Multimeric flavodoxin WrbA [Ruminococcaceae bacterium YAD3003]